MENQAKICYKCKTGKSLNRFSKHKFTKDKLSSYCKECMKKYQNYWRKNNKEKIKKRKRNYYQKNKQELKEKMKTYGKRYNH